MTEHETSTNLGIQVDSSLYTTAGYCFPGRFAAYAYQIKEILDCGAKTVLEIGPGNGVVTYVLRKAGIHVDTLDHDPALKPDFVGSVLDMPFQPNSYDAVMCCQVLEHLPWEHFSKAMQNISAVAKNRIVISLPHNSRRFFVEFKLPKIRNILWELDIPIKNNPISFEGEHYWEIGKGASEEDVLSIFKKINLTIKGSYRVPEYRYHHFFCLDHAACELE
ncbi:MAG: class I SAM-dependent methyltransferase [Pedobacter sp.]